MKSLSRNEMKNVRGGTPPPGGTCNVGATCMYYNGVGNTYSTCANIYVAAKQQFVCGCIGAVDPVLGQLLCPPNS